MPILSRCYWFYVDYISNFIIRIVSLIFPHVSHQDCSSPFKKTLPVVFAWGEQNSGALGLNGWEKKTICSPSQVFSLDGKEIQSISSGKGHTLVCLKDGKILSCGCNDFRQCGQDTNLNQLTLGEAGEGLQTHHVIQVAAGASHSVVLTQNHKVLTWGKNTEGQLGRGDVEESSRATPTLVKSLSVFCVLQVACGDNHTVILTDEGCVATWGADMFGQLGLGVDNYMRKHRNQPCFLDCLKGLPIAQVAAGGNHSFILSKSGAVYGWGRNSFGQLGLNDTVDHYSPNQCRPLRNERIKYICCGENHTACLTKDGRMFTFGLGTYGQLGHGSYKNELLPRLVIELSGSEISQIACGRNHTMAFDAKSEHLYTFGFGACGQLGLSTSENKNTPVIVAGSFILKTAQHTSMQVDNQGPDMKVKSIHAGGNHSFVIAEDIDMCQPDDYRIEDPTRQILTISQDRIEMLHSFQKNDIFSYELIEEMRKIFSNASCLNGSFLLPNEEHYNTNITKHGVDMSAVRTFFQEFAQFSNVELRQKILEALENLFLSMPECPLDEEALRVYLILPECHFLDQTELYSSIICPFAQSFLSLSKVNLIRIKFWWPMNQACFFDRLILIYKKCFKYLLEPQLQKKSLLEVRKCQSALFISLEMLKGLNEVNETNGEILPYNIFYVAELKEKVDIKEDYTNWTLKKKHQNHFWGVTLEPGLFLSKYPFLFDEKAKKMLLQSDAELKLQDAEGKSQNVMNLQWQLIDFSRLYLRLIVNRSTILQDTIEQLKYKNRSDLKKPFQIIIQGEEDVYQPVIQKEFFRVILAQIFNPDFRMFKIAPKSNLQWFCPLENSTITEELVNKFRLTGVLCGLGIYNSIITSLPFPLALYKKLLKKPVTQDDFRELDPYMEGAFQNLLDYDGDDIEDNFFLFFETLIPGDTRRVNHTCKAEYVDLYVDDILNKSVEVQFNAFSEGFHSVCDGSVLDSFHPQELHALVACEEDNDFEDLEKKTIYPFFYCKDHQTIKMFWEVFHEMSLENKKKFLIFVTGSDRIPIFGMKPIQIQPTWQSEDFLPVALLCHHILELPIYTKKETLKEKLLMAIQQTERFGLIRA